MYGTAFGIGNPNVYAQQPSPFGLSPMIGQGIGAQPFGLQPQLYGQQLSNLPFGITPQSAQTVLQQITQWLQLVPQQLQQLQRLEALQQQQLLQIQQLLQLVPQQLQQLQQLIQVLPHQVQQLQQQSPTLQPFGQATFSHVGVQPSGSPLGWYGGQTLVQ